MDIFEAEMARRFVVAVEKIANALDRKDEPTISKMEQVDEPKDEPQTAECPFDDTIPCEWVNCPNSTDCPYKQKTEPRTNGYQTFNGTSVYVSRFEDEPQTDCAWK